jgi:NADH-ubiquinone oxidoreductase chain 2
LGLTQFRIKRLYAYSTISHVGFILLALSINTTESIQAFIFYLLQYSISNLNAFVILIAVGYFYINFYKKDQDSNLYIKGKPAQHLKERNNSPLQLITQIKGLYKLNTMLSLSFAVTLFSFLGVPPLLGFFGKQMVLSASLDSGYVFMSLIAILTSVISAVYYLILIKQMFFDKSEYENINVLSKTTLNINSDNANDNYKDQVVANTGVIHVKLSSSITTIISILSLITIVFMFISPYSLNLTQILSLYIMSV